MRLGRNAALVAKALNVGIAFDYEENRSPNLTALEQFIRAYRGEGLPYDPSGVNHATRLTIDLAAGDRELAGARGWQAAVRAADFTARAGAAYRQRVSRGQQGHPGVQQFREFSAVVDGELRPHRGVEGEQCDVSRHVPALTRY